MGLTALRNKQGIKGKPATMPGRPDPHDPSTLRPGASQDQQSGGAPGGGSMPPRYQKLIDEGVDPGVVAKRFQDFQAGKLPGQGGVAPSGQTPGIVPGTMGPGRSQGAPTAMGPGAAGGGAPGAGGGVSGSIPGAGGGNILPNGLPMPNITGGPGALSPGAWGALGGAPLLPNGMPVGGGATGGPVASPNGPGAPGAAVGSGGGVMNAGSGAPSSMGPGGNSPGGTQGMGPGAPFGGGGPAQPGFGAPMPGSAPGSMNPGAGASTMQQAVQALRRGTPPFIPGPGGTDLGNLNPGGPFVGGGDIRPGAPAGGGDLHNFGGAPTPVTGPGLRSPGAPTTPGLRPMLPHEQPIPGPGGPGAPGAGAPGGPSPMTQVDYFHPNQGGGPGLQSLNDGGVRTPPALPNGQPMANIANVPRAIPDPGQIQAQVARGLASRMGGAGGAFNQ